MHMPRYLLDTNILLYAYKDQGQCRTRLAQTPADDLAISSILVYEIEYGLVKSSNPDRLRTFLSQVQQRYVALDMCSKSAVKAGQLRGYLEQQGQIIGPYDLLLAGIAVAHDLTIVTRNTREFERAPGLRVENWYD
jgi:tRNA(fMet)-specific endonuclease VapC